MTNNQTIPPDPEALKDRLNQPPSTSEEKLAQVDRSLTTRSGPTSAGNASNGRSNPSVIGPKKTEN